MIAVHSVTAPRMMCWPIPSRSALGSSKHITPCGCSVCDSDNQCEGERSTCSEPTFFTTPVNRDTNAVTAHADPATVAASSETLSTPSRACLSLMLPLYSWSRGALCRSRTFSSVGQDRGTGGHVAQDGAYSCRHSVCHALQGMSGESQHVTLL